MKAETKVEHTAGPWTYRLKVLTEKGIDDNGQYIDPFTIPDYYAIEAGAGFWGSVNNPQGFDIQAYMTEANARLISAAPDLLEALESITLSMKAHPDCTEGSEFYDMVSIAEDAIRKARGL